jgi:molybdopterin-guanine dinucleotide biosynthesis protein A
MKVGLLLLTGGLGTRMGTPKHGLLHPSGCTWSHHLVAVFQTVFPEGPVQVLGEALLDRPDLPVLDDPRQGPMVALQRWAASPAPTVDRWWVVACDQVRWQVRELRAWADLAQNRDPDQEHWMIGRFAGHLQPLGGFLPHHLRPALAHTEARSLLGLVEALPHLILDSDLPGWRDVDTPAELATFEGEHGRSFEAGSGLPPLPGGS